MTEKWKMDAYAAVSARFGLRHWQRTALDTCAQYEEIMAAERDGDFNLVRGLLDEAGILNLPRP